MSAVRFYLDRSGSAAVQLALTLGSMVLVGILIGAFSLMAVGVWVLVDAFLIPEMICQYNKRLIMGLSYR